MDDFFDRVGRILRSLFGEDDDKEYDSVHWRYSDPDMDDAFEELDEFLKTGKDSRTRRRQYSWQNGYSSSYRSSYSARRNGAESDLAQDYKTLEVPFGASFEEVKKSYKKLLRQYHPDKHANDPEKLKTATEITQRLNAAFARIEKYESEKNNP